MDRFAALSCFVAVADSGSFSAAGRHLGKTQSAVSQQVRALEASLKTRLFERTTRSLSLTEAGARYLEHARAIVDRLAEADSEVGDAETAMSGRLAIGAPIGFGNSVLSRYLFQFQRQYPRIQLDVSLTDRFVDLVAEGLDLTVRMGGVVDERLVVRRIGMIERCLAATPGYLDRKGRPRHPGDLAGHDYVLHTMVMRGERFSLVHGSGETAEVRVTPCLRSDNSILTGEAIAEGLGIGLIHQILLAPMLCAGTLERVLPDWHFPPQPVHALYPSNRYIPRKVRIFIDGLVRYLKGAGVVDPSDRDDALQREDAMNVRF